MILNHSKTFQNTMTTTANYLDLLTDDIMENILDHSLKDLEKTIEDLVLQIKEHGKIRYQLLRNGSTFPGFIRFQLGFGCLPAIKNL